MAQNIYNFAYFNEAIIPEEEIYRENNDKIHRGKIFCPECHQAKLTVRGSKNKKSLTDIPGIEHSKDCSYRYRRATPKQARFVFNETERFDVNKQFNRVFTTLYKSTEETIPGGLVFNCPANLKQPDGKVRKVTIPLVNLEKIDDTTDVNKEQFFYGKCRLVPSKLQSGNYLIKVLAPKSSFQYFAIEVTEKTYKYLPSTIKNPNRKSEKGVNFLYFGKLTADKKGWKSTKLRSANYIKTYLPVEIDEETKKPVKKKTKLNMQQLKLLKTKYNK